MSATVYLASDGEERQFIDAGQWEAGVAVRVSDGSVGLGFFLFDKDGRPIAGCCMTPEQALAQGLYLVESAKLMQSAVAKAIVDKVIEVARERDTPPAAG